MDTAGNIEKEVDAKKGRLNERYTRMDDDFEIWQGVRSTYDKTIDKRTRKHPTDIEVINNDLRTFADGVQSILSSSERVIAARMLEVEGEDKRGEIGKLENLLEFGFKKADERLANLLLPPLVDQLWWFSIVRGWMAGRFLVWKEGDNVIFDYKALDPRWLPYQMGANGLLWTGALSFRSGSELEDEYGKDEKWKANKVPWYKPWQKEKDNYTVIDYWLYEGEKKMGNAVITNGSFLKDPDTYNMPSMPTLIAPVATRPPVRGETDNYVAGYGESIFASVRDINGINNRFMSIIATHANKLANQAMLNYRTDKGVEITSTTNVPGSVVDLVMGEQRLEPSPMPEISPTVLQIQAWFGDRIERGTLPHVSIGTPPASGTMTNIVVEEGNRVFNPQLRNGNAFFSSICRLVEEQLIMGGVGGEKIKRVKGSGIKKNKYYEVNITPVDLKKPHIIEVEFVARTPYRQLETAQIAEMLKRGGIPDKWLWEHIYKFPDPKLIEDLAVLEMYEHSPEGAMKRAVEVLMKHGYEFEAQKLIKKLDMMEMAEEAQMMGGITGEGAPGEEPPSPEVIPPGGAGI